MRVLGPAVEADVVAAYVRAELDSERFGKQVRELSAGSPIRVRCWPSTGAGGETRVCFHGFPAEVEWCRVGLERHELLSVLYIDWDWWLTVSGGTRSPVVASERIRASGDAAELEHHRRIAERLHTSEPPPELILVTDPARSRLVVVEGHVRLTAYALFPEYLPRELEAFLGESAEIGRWGSF